MPIVLLAAVPRPARAADAVEDINKLNKKALEAYDNLDFERARKLLEDALGAAESAGLGDDPVAARTHLHLGLVFSAGLKRTDDAKAEFRAALKIQPDIVPTAGLFNPESQALFDSAKAEAPPPPPKRAVVPPKKRVQQPEPEPEPQKPGSLFLAFGVGSGAGVAKGNVETNVNNAGDLYEWQGGLALSKLVHVALSAGYFVTPALLVSLEGRLQLVTGTSKAAMNHCAGGSCSPPGSAIAGLARASWFLTEEGPRPFVSGALGGGRIRQVVKLNGLSDCGSGNQQCVDTVAGGPLLLGAGGGVAYDVGPLTLLAGATAYVGVPDFMLNVDVTIGAGLRL